MGHRELCEQRAMATVDILKINFRMSKVMIYHFVTKRRDYKASAELLVTLGLQLSSLAINALACL